ncbi:MAG: type II toxin-antitoxin system RelE/ParE family toxin [Proteobacteria bacterium]|nr:type II toxin-antitoxin system RelE/ParE family toxin [Pseudomonadota bacterium]MCP4288449.1 type II toxin-antitoxin system RelE/ParE family toxin [Gammaproteobacteria bacterium]
MVIWTQPAKADLRSIHDFVANDSPHYAKKVVQDIREKTDILEQLPKRGKKIPELNNDHVRELSLYSYRIIYKIKEQGIFVLAVVHKRRDLKIDDISRD